MNAVKTAQEILRYYRETKGRGHSKAVVYGAEASRANIVVADDDKGKKMGIILGRKLATLSEVGDGALDGSNYKPMPLVLDNGALKALLEGLLAVIDAKAEAKVEPAKDEPKQLKKFKKAYLE